MPAAEMTIIGPSRMQAMRDSSLDMVASNLAGKNLDSGFSAENSSPSLWSSGWSKKTLVAIFDMGLSSRTGTLGIRPASSASLIILPVADVETSF